MTKPYEQNSEQYPETFELQKAVLEITPSIEYCFPIPKRYYARPTLGEIVFNARYATSEPHARLREEVQYVTGEQSYIPGIRQPNIADSHAKEAHMARIIAGMNVSRATKHMLQDSIRNSSHMHATESAASFGRLEKDITSDDELRDKVESKLASDTSLAKALFRTEYGLASPDECLESFDELPFTSIELARYSFYLVPNPEVDNEMHDDVRDAIVARGGVVYDEPRLRRVKIKQVDALLLPGEKASSTEGHMQFMAEVYDSDGSVEGYTAQSPSAITVSYKVDIGESRDGSLIRQRKKFYIQLDNDLLQLCNDTVQRLDDANELNAQTVLEQNDAITERLLWLCEQGESDTVRPLTTGYYAFREEDQTPRSNKKVHIDTLVDAVLSLGLPVHREREIMVYLGAIAREDDSATLSPKAKAELALAYTRVRLGRHAPVIE